MVIWVNTCSNTPPKKTLPQPSCWSYPHYLSIDLSICIVSIQSPSKIPIKFAHISNRKRIPCGFNPSGKYARQWVILFHIWFNITAFFEWSAIRFYAILTHSFTFYLTYTLTVHLAFLSDISYVCFSGIWSGILSIMYLTFYLAFGILSHMYSDIRTDMLSRILAFSLLAIGDGDVWWKSRDHLAKGQRTYTFFAKNQIIGDQDPHHLPIL